MPLFAFKPNALHETVSTKQLVGPKLITFVGQEGPNPVRGTYDGEGKHTVIVCAGLFLPEGAKLSFGITNVLISYVVDPA
jgi:hypothetical protein